MPVDEMNRAIYDPEDHGWRFVDDLHMKDQLIYRLYEKTLGESEIKVLLRNTHTTSNVGEQTLGVEGEWTVEGEDVVIPLRDVSDATVLQKLDEKFIRFAVAKDRRDLRQASRGGSIIKKKGRSVVNPFTI